MSRDKSLSEFEKKIIVFPEKNINTNDIAQRLHCSPNVLSHYLKNPLNYKIKTKVDDLQSCLLMIKGILNGNPQKMVVFALKQNVILNPTCRKLLSDAKKSHGTFHYRLVNSAPFTTLAHKIRRTRCAVERDY